MKKGVVKESFRFGGVYYPASGRKQVELPDTAHSFGVKNALIKAAGKKAGPELNKDLGAAPENK